MKKIILVLVTLLSFSALAQSKAELRNAVGFIRASANEQYRSVADLVTKCDQIDQVVQRRKLVLDAVSGHLVALKLKNTTNTAAVLNNVQKASEVLDWAKTDCLNNMNRAQVLTEMYLLNVDTELMIIMKELE